MTMLRDEHKRYIVQQLACFASSTEIQSALSAMGVPVTLSRIAYYDASLPSAAAGARWRQLFALTRAQFVIDTASIAISHKSFRLRELDSNYRTLKRRNNLIGANAVLEQAAKEMGEAYTNRRVIETGDPAAALAALLGVTADEIVGADAAPHHGRLPS